MADMKRQLVWSKLKAGLVITGSCLLLIFTVFFAGGISKVYSRRRRN